MEIHYLTPELYIKDNKTYYEGYEIKRNNWHRYLSEIGWGKLHKQWISQLNKLNKHYYKNNSLFGSLECGNDGDCLFHCIAYAINSIESNMYDSKDIRKIVADSVTSDEYDNIITCYRSMKDLDDFDEGWDPYDINSLDRFKDILKTSGHSYWCDHLILQLVMKTFTINLLILSQNEFTDYYKPYLLANNYDCTKHTIIILHENDSHFKLIGYFQGTMKLYFTNDTIPCEIKALFNLK